MSREQSDRWREAVVALDRALSAAMQAVDSLVHGHGPRGAALLPLIELANDAADKRDAVLNEDADREASGQMLLAEDQEPITVAPDAARGAWEPRRSGYSREQFEFDRKHRGNS